MATQQDIAGFRRAHKRIPARMAMQDDQAELAARQQAVGSMKQAKPNKVPLTNYGQFGAQNAIGSGGTQPSNRPSSPGMSRGAGVGQTLTQQETEEQRLLRLQKEARERAIGKAAQGVPSDRANQANTLMAGGGSATVDGRGVALPGLNMAERGAGVSIPGTKQEQDPGDPYGLRGDLQDIFDRLDDQKAAEERIARARAAQSAGVRAAMGAGETGMSGAAALLEGEAGRLAESQARAAELAQDLDVAALGSALMGFDLAKDRYDTAEKRQAASAAMYLAQAYDVSYDEAFEMLGLPDSAKSDEARETFNEWASNLGSDDEVVEETEITEEEAAKTATKKDKEEKTEEDYRWLEEIFVGPLSMLAGDVIGGFVRGEINSFQSFLDALGWSASNSLLVQAARGLWDQIRTDPRNR